MMEAMEWGAINWIVFMGCVLGVWAWAARDIKRVMNEGKGKRKGIR
jgi:hypothetical protein